MYGNALVKALTTEANPPIGSIEESFNDEVDNDVLVVLGIAKALGFGTKDETFGVVAVDISLVAALEGETFGVVAVDIPLVAALEGETFGVVAVVTSLAEEDVVAAR